MTTKELLPFTGNPDADRLLADDPLALLIGFALDQQVTLQKAFSGPLELSKRIGGLDAKRIAAMDPAELDTVFRDASGAASLPGQHGEADAGDVRLPRRAIRRRRLPDLARGDATAPTSTPACSTSRASAR